MIVVKTKIAMRVLSILFITFVVPVILCDIDIDNLGRYPPYISTLTNEICTRRPKIQYLRLWRSGIEIIEDGALHDCKDVKNIWLELNHIKSLKSNTFLYKDELEEINLRNNQLEYIEESVFHDLKKLKSLSLECNKLHRFSPEYIKNVPALHIITLDANPLLDIDTQAILKSAPMLDLITLNSTLIQCSRLIEIARELNSAEKRLAGLDNCDTQFLRSDLALTRVYLSRFSEFFGTSNYQSYFCIPDDKWNKIAAIATANYETLKLKYV